MTSVTADQAQIAVQQGRLSVLRRWVAENPVPAGTRPYMPDHWQCLKDAIRHGQKAAFDLLLPLFPDCISMAAALYEAATCGRLDMAQILLPRSNLNEQGPKPLEGAVNAGGHLDMIRLLAPLSGCHVATHALQQAAHRGQCDTVSALLPFSAPQAENSLALYWASDAGHTDVVRLLIPVSNPLDLNSRALMSAARKGHGDVVALLAPVSEVAHVASEIARTLKSNNDHWDTAALELIGHTAPYERWKLQSSAGPELRARMDARLLEATLEQNLPAAENGPRKPRL